MCNKWWVAWDCESRKGWLYPLNSCETVASGEDRQSARSMIDFFVVRNEFSDIESQASLI